jgi:hypothetical protein
MQHFDGTIEESEPFGWISLQAEAAGAPEDWSGSLDMNYEDIADRYRPLLRDWQTRLEMLDDPD